jgi:hypothetical protein
MSRRYPVFLAAVLIAGGTVAAQLSSPDFAVNRPAIGDQLRQLNNLGRIANQKQDDVSIRIFTDSIIDSALPAGPASNVLKERLFALERQHRTTKDVGITESSLARGINAFVGRIGAPEFARTNTLQLRVFRASLHFLALPDVVAPTLGEHTLRPDSADPGAIDEIPPEIGPAEATLLIVNLVHSKLLSPDMQIPLDGWSKAVLIKKEQARQNRVAALANGHSDSSPGPVTHVLMGLQPTPEGAALRGSLSAFAQNVQATDSLRQELERFIEESRHE